MDLVLNEKHYLNKTHAKESVNGEIDALVPMDLAPVSWNRNENRNHEYILPLLQTIYKDTNKEVILTTLRSLIEF